MIGNDDLEAGYTLKLVDKMNLLEDFEWFFWNYTDMTVERGFWISLSAKAHSLKFNGYASLCDFFATGKISQGSSKTTIDEKLKLLKEEHYVHSTDLNNLESILRLGILCHRYLQKLGIDRHGIWGRTRSINFIFFHPNLLSGIHDNILGLVSLCINPRLKHEISGNREEAMYPGAIQISDVIAICVDNETLGKEIIDMQRKIIKNASKYGLPVIVSGKIILKP